MNSGNETARRASDSDLDREYIDFLNWQHKPRKPFGVEMEKVIQELRAEMRRAAREAFESKD